MRESTMLDKYCNELIKNGFLKSLYDFDKEIRFYKMMQDYTAFIINLSVVDDKAVAVFGAASVAFIKFKGDEDRLKEHGVYNEDISIREKIAFNDTDSENIAERKIAELYEKTKNLSKDELLLKAKEKRKVFVSKFAVALKSLGFKKNALTWTKKLNEDFFTAFNLQKSMYSDQYYFNVYIGAYKFLKTDRGSCFFTRLSAEGEESPLDWQLTEEYKLNVFIEKDVVGCFREIIEAALSELGKRPYIWEGCHCQRDICEACWVERNVWEREG